MPTIVAEVTSGYNSLANRALRAILSMEQVAADVNFG
jgi:hypothetical protein